LQGTPAGDTCLDALGAAYHGVMLVDRAPDEVLWYHVDESWNDG
jgi:hypothetical protein